MTFSAFLALLPALLGLSASGAQRDGGQTVRTLVVQDEIIMRIPVRPRFAPLVEWVESKGPKCIPAEAIRGATLSGRDQVDFLLLGRERMRAQLGDECPALDFYNGFYLSPEDERVCAGRDTIRSRTGGSCRIQRFQRLEPRRRR